MITQSALEAVMRKLRDALIGVPDFLSPPAPEQLTAIPVLADRRRTGYVASGSEKTGIMPATPR